MSDGDDPTEGQAEPAAAEQIDANDPHKAEKLAKLGHEGEPAPAEGSE